MSIMQVIALGQPINARERAILSANEDVAAGWVVAAGYARMISNAYGYTSGNLSKSIGLGKADALRHCLWSALLTYQVGEHYAKLLNDAHEEQGTIKDHNSNLDREMDYHNNAVGRRLGKMHAESGFVAKTMTAFFVWGVCKQALDSGQLRVIDRSKEPWRLVRSDQPGLV